MSDTLKESALQIRNSIRDATRGFVGREQLAELMILAAVAQEHLLVIGPPGTAKSAVVRRVAAVLGGHYFEYLLGRFTEPSELFGAVDLKKLREGLVETDVRGMLPEAEIAFLDEIFLGSTAILNTLLGILNERRFRRGHTQLDCPLRICVGAANGLPEDEALMAFADRFLLHLFVQPIADHLLENMLASGWQADQGTLLTQNNLPHLDRLCAMLPQVQLEQVRPQLTNAIRRLRTAGLSLSDRRIVKSQRLIAAAAVLDGRLQALESDLWPLVYVLPTFEAQQSAREVLQEVLSYASNQHLFSSVEEASLQPMSRLARLTEAAAESLRLFEGADLGAAQRAAEVTLREIDANFASENLPASLVAVRSQLIARLGQTAV